MAAVTAHKILTIVCDVALPPAALALLESGVSPHCLIVRQNKSLDDADIVFGQPDPAALLSSNVKWAHISSAGITRYDTPEVRTSLREKGITLTNSSSVYFEPCAEHLLAFMLAASRNLPTSLASQHVSPSTPEWAALRNSMALLVGQSAVILGYGAIARRLVELLAPFRMSIVGFRRNPRGDEGVPMVSTDGDLSVALSATDHVINILPDSAETHRFFNAVRFDSLKRGVFFYNIGRGATVDQEALADALHRGTVAAAWLDVSDPEPLPADHPLVLAPNCHITPHLGGGQTREKEALVEHFVKNVAAHIAGRGMADVVV